MPQTAADLAPRNQRRTMAAFVLGVFLFWVALYLYLPTLPPYIETKSESLATVGVVNSSVIPNTWYSTSTSSALLSSSPAVR